MKRAETFIPEANGNAFSGALFKSGHPLAENLRQMEEEESPKLSSLARLARDITHEGKYRSLAELKSALALSIADKTPSLAPLFEDLAPKDYRFSARTLLAWTEAMEKGQGDDFLKRVVETDKLKVKPDQNLTLATTMAPLELQLRAPLTPQIFPSAQIDSNRLIAMKAVLDATHIDLPGLVNQAIDLSARVNANLPSMASDFARSLAVQTDAVLNQIKDGALKSVHRFSIRDENQSAIEERRADGQPSSRSMSHRLATSQTTDTENFPKNTSLTTGGGSMNMTGSAVNISSGFKAAVASFGKGQVPEHDIEITDHGAHIHVEPGSSGFVAAAGGASVTISAPSVSISIGPTTISRG